MRNKFNIITMLIILSIKLKNLIMRKFNKKIILLFVKNHLNMGKRNHQTVLSGIKIIIIKHFRRRPIRESSQIKIQPIHILSILISSIQEVEVLFLMKKHKLCRNQGYNTKNITKLMKNIIHLMKMKNQISTYQDLPKNQRHNKSKSINL